MLVHLSAEQRGQIEGGARGQPSYQHRLKSRLQHADSGEPSLDGAEDSKGYSGKHD